MVGESTDPCRKPTVEGRSVTPSQDSQCRPPPTPASLPPHFLRSIIFRGFKLCQLPPPHPSIPFSVSLSLKCLIVSVLKDYWQPHQCLEGNYYIC